MKDTKTRNNETIAEHSPWQWKETSEAETKNKNGEQEIMTTMAHLGKDSFGSYGQFFLMSTILLHNLLADSEEVYTEFRHFEREC